MLLHNGNFITINMEYTAKNERQPQDMTTIYAISHTHTSYMECSQFYYGGWE